MTDLGPILSRLGLDQYHDVLVQEGFDTWDVVLDIQESDFDALNFKLGHRRKLQREIANHRGISYERSIGSPGTDIIEASKSADSPSTPPSIPEGGGHGSSETKRKYRRHPKVDENAPVRAPSAYVVFSNKIREDVRGQNMSFTDIAKLVGDKWQKLSPHEKEPYEAHAAGAKERYNIELAEYRKTDGYREYLRYLADFKVKHGGQATDNKRPRLEGDSNIGNTSAKSIEAPDFPTVVPNHIRVGSINTAGSAASQGEMTSPAQYAPYFGQGMQSIGARLPPMSPSNDTSSSSLLSRDSRPYVAFSSQSSISDDSSTVREYPDPLAHAAQLSLLPGPARQNEHMLQSPVSLDVAHLSSGNRRPLQVRTPLGSHNASSGSRSSGSLRSTMNSSEGSFQFPAHSADDPWRSPNHPPIPLGAVTLPPLIAPERLPSDFLQDQSQRILPMPTPSSSASSDSYAGLRGLSRISTRSNAMPQDHPGPVGMSFGLNPENKSPLDKSESEAADALAGLAYNSRREEPGARNDARRPP